MTCTETASTEAADSIGRTRASLEQADLIVLIDLIASHPRQPNTLLVSRRCRVIQPDDLFSSRRAGGAPVDWCPLPGTLILPERRGRSVLVLADVAALTWDQQVAFHEWLGTRNRRVQVISIAETPLETLLTTGRFLSALYYRLNTIRLDPQA